MKKKTILTIMGTRPEAIKLVPLVLELEKRSEQFNSVVCVTGQHREMLDQVLDAFGVTADHDLNLMAPNQTLGLITSRATSGLDQVFAEVKPHACLVQGDTTTAFCGALVGHYHQTTVGHVEAGLRTGNKFSPFPEEMNRVLIGRLADLHFPPTQHAYDALITEGVSPDLVTITGNTVIDSLLLTRERVTANLPEDAKVIQEVIGNQRTVLITGHRRESHGQGFINICQAIRRLADRHQDVQFVYPVHLNPNVQKPVHEILGNHPRIHLVQPLSYDPFVWLMNRCDIVLTDSGGVQEEAPSFGKPVLVMRDTTERPEGVEAGNAILVGTNRDKIESEMDRLLTDEEAYRQMSTATNPYGDGTASQKIADILAKSELV